MKIDTLELEIVAGITKQSTMHRSKAITLILLSATSLVAVSAVSSPKASAVKRRRKVPRSHHRGRSIGCVDDVTLSDCRQSSQYDNSATLVGITRGGEAEKAPSIYWAVFHNWLYFMSLGFNLINIQFLVREIVDGDAKASPSAKSIALSGKVESVDKLLTFMGIGFLSALSDKLGRKPLM